MSNYLTKPYEISLWEDDPSGTEVKICTIGTDTMEGQNRAFEPIFSRNVNGVKKLSFKIYKKYVDIQTGKEVDNSYMSYLISERKVKLYLPEEPIDNQWHDFIIKNISENSATYLCTYQLEDALVQELSKNGFGVTLDAKLMNNIGTANELASYVLRETDWDVSDNSEVFVQTIDEALVYLKITKTSLPQNTKIYKIIGQNNLKIGITDSLVYGKNEQGVLVDTFFTEETEKTILAFYSSCTGKPHRFQFLYSENGVYNTEEELKNYISNETDYQYYIDFDNPEDDYSVLVQDFFLPVGFNTTTVENSVLCTDYRGRRYGFSQQAKYIPVLDRYVQLYKKGDQKYYGYEHAEYKSPALTQNMISNSTFESISGWTGTKNGAGGKAKVEAVYGYFGENGFVNAIDELKNGTFDPEKKTYKSYLKLVFDDANSIVINSGPFDNRTLIGNMVAGDEWALWSKVIGPGALSFTLGEYKYSSVMDGYESISGEISFSNIIKTETKNNKTYSIYTVESSSSSEESFKKNMNVRLQISALPGTYYLEEIELFKVARYNNTIIPLEEQADSLEDRAVEKTYYYFTDEALTDITSADQLKPEATAKTLSYTTYKPVYNEGAQKVRTITAKESNYFNILQSIAETFETWLTFDVVRNINGGITNKKIAFKNYVGGDNYACFRYGVNLKDIQRTFESKNIVTKLIVKNNSNEHADGGFCTIQRANANPTGENYIYDFQYFFNQGLMNNREYLDTLYVIDGAQGPDNVIWTSGVSNDTLNLQGYFPRIKALNNKIQTESELLANISQDLTQYKADLAVAEAGLDAATSGIQEVKEDFLLLTGVTIDMLSGHTINSIEVGNRQNSEDEAKENGGWYYTDRDWIGSVSVTPSEDKKSIKAIVNIASSIPDSEHLLYIKVYPTISLSKNGSTTTLSQYYNIKCAIKPNATSGSSSVDIEIVNSSRNDVQKKLQEYAVCVANENKYISEKATLQTQVDALEAQYNEKQNYIENSLKEWKRQLNQLFFQTYSRFIQEGTWINEEYVDDGLYYADAQSVMYNSCYPQVAYTINVISVEGLPGYEDFIYKLGEKTWVVDPDFFGDEDRESVIITEIVENLDDRSKNQIKVQNFKNQFQDLFQKITATVQQAQYNTGSYEKAVALAEANQEKKQQFLTDALDSASAKLTTAGQQSVTWGSDGITVKSINSPNDAIRMVGGAILLSKQDENGQQKWVTGVTSDGVSASLITAGVLNAGEISIMNYDEPVFRWDTFGISAYDATWYNGGTDVGTVISGVNTNKFVRFDKHGIYGINGGVDGANWYPQDSNEIDEKSTFALTWEGLKVTGNKDNDGNQIIAKIGKNNNSILNIINTKIDPNKTSDKSQSIFRIGDNGSVLIRGSLEIEGDSGIYKDVTEYVNEIGLNLQKQIDGAITTYFEEGEPALDNYPANGWTEDDEKDKHLGDLYYNTDTQYCYRWAKIRGIYQWELVRDEGITQALSDAARAQSTADGKRTTYGYNPKDNKPSNYQNGDLWIIPRDNTTSFTVGSKEGIYAGEILQCILSYSGDYRPTDWIVATKYTDNTELNEFKQEYTNTLKDINNQLDKKAETHYQDTDPAIYSGEDIWGAERVGDLWHCSAEIKDGETIIREKDSEWIWQGTTNEGFTYYSWHEMTVSDIVFNTINGKANIYVSLPKNEDNLKEGDLFIPAKDGEYGQGKIYRLEINEDGQKTWEEVAYTDDTTANEAKNIANEVKNELNNKLDNEAPTGNYYWKIDPEQGLQIKSGGKSGVEVFRVGNLKGLPEHPEEDGDISGLWMRGTVEADSGMIGGWKISPGQLSSFSDNGGISLFSNTTEKYNNSALSIVAGNTQPKERQMWKQYNRPIGQEKTDEVLCVSNDLQLANNETTEIQDCVLINYKQIHSKNKTHHKNLTSQSFSHSMPTSTVKSFIEGGSLGARSSAMSFNRNLSNNIARWSYNLGTSLLGIYDNYYFLIKINYYTQYNYLPSYFLCKCTYRNNTSISFTIETQATTMNHYFSIKYGTYGNYDSTMGDATKYYYTGFYLYCQNNLNYIDTCQVFVLGSNSSNILSNSSYRAYVTDQFPTEDLTEEMRVELPSQIFNWLPSSDYYSYASYSTAYRAAEARMNGVYVGTFSPNTVTKSYYNTLSGTRCVLSDNIITENYRSSYSYIDNSYKLTINSFSLLLQYFLRLSGTVNFSYSLEKQAEDYTNTTWSCTLKQVGEITLPLNSTSWPIIGKVEDGNLNIYEPANILNNDDRVSFSIKYGIKIINTSQYPFILTQDGQLYASNVVLAGDITATRLRQSLVGRLKCNISTDEKYMPLLNFSILDNEYVVYTTFTESANDLNNDNIVGDIESVGNLFITTLDLWNDETQFKTYKSNKEGET